MEELKPLKETTTAIIEKEIKDISFEDLLSQEPEQKKESAKKMLFTNSTERYIEQLKRSSAIYFPSVSTAPTKIQFEAAKTFFNEEPKKEIIEEKETAEETLIKTLPKVEIEPLTFIKNKKEVEIEEGLEQEKIIDEEEKTIKRIKASPKVNFKSRLKIIAFGFVAVLTCFLGWSIYNAVEIQTLRAQIEASNKTYGVNIYNYIKNISKADDLTSDSIFNLQDLSDAGIVPLEPSALNKPVEYTIKSNWFDRFCNWLSGVFK